MRQIVQISPETLFSADIDLLVSFCGVHQTSEELPASGRLEAVATQLFSHCICCLRQLQTNYLTIKLEFEDCSHLGGWHAACDALDSIFKVRNAVLLNRGTIRFGELCSHSNIYLGVRSNCSDRIRWGDEESVSKDPAGPAQHSETWIPRSDLHVTISVAIECGSKSILDLLILDADTISI